MINTWVARKKHIGLEILSTLKLAGSTKQPMSLKQLKVCVSVIQFNTILNKEKREKKLKRPRL